MIPEEIVPLTPLGKMVLDRNPDNFFAEAEQVAFHTGHIVPGIDFTNAKRAYYKRLHSSEFPCAVIRSARLMRLWRWVTSVRACLMIVG